MKQRCPHADIRFCPLYHAAHMDGSFGCDDGRLDEGGCAVARGWAYDRAVARLDAAMPRLVAELRWKEEAAEDRLQRDRNMRFLGLH
ncbi:hypothetical protein DXT96_07410 [Agrobacterium sp. ICMP 6402]|uniref:hypothetical protein n=1 Tax=Agrobacterium sp. ICMP 6402 TaxID=2292443 RepID=UPI0012966E18|nr:hypothetical protein [Agrobacterium sp. ICMP 6402]MQB09681.1 hypothetical protein [Agrobacterium sp. ICMP 6402]